MKEYNVCLFQYRKEDANSGVYRKWNKFYAHYDASLLRDTGIIIWLEDILKIKKTDSLEKIADTVENSLLKKKGFVKIGNIRVAFCPAYNEVIKTAYIITIEKSGKHSVKNNEIHNSADVY